MAAVWWLIFLSIESALRAHQLTLQGCKHWWLWHSCLLIGQKIFQRSYPKSNNSCLSTGTDYLCMIYITSWWRLHLQHCDHVLLGMHRSMLKQEISTLLWCIAYASRWLSDKESICNSGDVGSIPGLGRSPGVGNGTPSKAMAPHSSTLAWKIPWTKEPGMLQTMGSRRVGTQQSDFTFTFPFHALEKETATHSSVLAWRIPGMGEPGGLPSMGSHRVGHDWSGLAAAAAASILTWRIPWTEEPGRLQFMVLQRVEPNWETEYKYIANTITWVKLHPKFLNIFIWLGLKIRLIKTD